jgi:hypothetical protein
VFLTSRSRQTIRRQNRFTPVYAVANAALQAIADCVLQPVVLLAAVAFLLGGGNRQVAAFAVIAAAAWALAPIALYGIRAILAQSYPIVIFGGALRLIGALVIGFIGLRIDDISTNRVTGALIVAYLLYQAGSALANQASAGLLVTAVGRNRQAGIYRNRNVVALIAAVAAAFACWSVFRSGEVFQRALGLVLILAAMSAIAATWFQLSITGGIASAPHQRLTWSTLRAPLLTVPYRRYLAFKILLALVAAVDPFLIVYGFRELGLQMQYVGLALVAYVIGQVAGQVAWPRWIAGHSSRIPFQVAALLRLLLLAWILALPSLATSSFYTDRYDDLTMAMRGFAIGFGLLGLATSVGNAANQRYLLDIAPRGTIQAPILLTNMVASVTAFAPLGVVWLLGRYELERVLWGAIGVAIVALLASGLLIESRVRVRAAAGSWRTRRQQPRAA